MFGDRGGNARTVIQAWFQQHIDLQPSGTVAAVYGPVKNGEDYLHGVGANAGDSVPCDTFCKWTCPA